MPRSTVVVAALIQSGARLLIAQRRRDDRHPLKWEFPGGKVEPGETAQAALRRELEEELGVDATVGREIARYRHRYEGRPPLLLIFYAVTEFRGEIENRVFERVCWERPERLSDYDFLDGDLEIVRRLARSGLPPAR